MTRSVLDYARGVGLGVCGYAGMGVVGNLSLDEGMEQERHMYLEYYTLDVFFFSCLFYYYTIPEQQYEALLNYNLHILDPGFVFQHMRHLSTW
jgi:hypothetical protein